MRKFFLKGDFGPAKELSETELERHIKEAMECNGPAAMHRPERKGIYNEIKKGEFVWHCSENSLSPKISRPSTREEIMERLLAGEKIYTSPYMGPCQLYLGEPTPPPAPRPEPEERTSCWECGGLLNSSMVCVICGEDNNN